MASGENVTIQRRRQGEGHSQAPHVPPIDGGEGREVGIGVRFHVELVPEGKEYNDRMTKTQNLPVSGYGGGKQSRAESYD